MDSTEFFTSALDALPEHICIINVTGDILFVNRSWTNFEITNSTSPPTHWHNVNYFNICENAIENTDDEISHLLTGLKAVATGELPTFSFEYPCHSPTTQRWFVLNCFPFFYKQNTYLLLEHVNITEKKQADTNSSIDELTGVHNRRAFNEFFEKEWLRCARSKLAISVVMIDVDDFKIFNDTYGHVKGDWCLKVISHELKKLAKRPTDIFCRYGGEEFIYVLGDTTSEQAQIICCKIHQALKNLNIKHEAIKYCSHVTVSIGSASASPHDLADKNMLIELADSYLYEAKALGKSKTIYLQR